MRVIAYNILNGGEGRADPIAEVIEAQRADVVVLVEAEELSVVERIASRGGMDFIVGMGKGRGGAILSRWPIVSSVNHAAMVDEPFSCFLEAHVADPAGVVWPVVGVHLHPRALEADEAVRERQLAVLLERLKPLQGTPHVLAGDFNANSPVQQIDPAQCKPATQEAWEKNGRKLPRRAIQRLLSNVYTDSLEAFDPQAARTAGSFTTQHPGQRVDYVFTHGVEKNRIKNAWIETDRLAKYASDHFPVGVEIS